MKINYDKLTKSELVKEIKKLNSDIKKLRGNKISDEVEKLKKQIEQRDIEIKEQKSEISEKQNQLDNTRDKYENLYDYAPTGYVTLSSNGIIEEINLTGAEIISIDAQKAVGIPFAHFLIKEDHKRFADYLKSCQKSSSHCVDKFTLDIKKSKQIIVELTTLPYVNYKSNKLSLRVSISDVTDQEKIEKALIESEERFRLMADSSPNFIWMTDKDNQLEYMNRTKLNFLGKKFEDLRKNHSWINTRHPEDRDNFQKQFEKASNTYKAFTTEIRVKNSKGEFRWLLESAAPRFLKDGTFIGYIGSSMDITELKENRLKLEKSLKEKEVLLKEIHHRVKNNLQIISSLLNLQRGYIKDDKMLNIFRSSQSRISAMALLHEKLYGSKNLSDIDIKDYIRSITRSLLDTYRNNVQDIRIKLDVEEIRLNLDTSINIGLIINELVSNSLKYAFREKKEGTISIFLKKKKDDDLILKISDDGVGLPKDLPAKPRQSLGLELVSNIVEQLQGNLEISDNGITEFKILVPQNNLHS